MTEPVMWRVANTASAYLKNIVSEDGRLVAGDIERSDSSLIAAAPAMLDALKGILEFVSSMDSAAAKAVQTTALSAIAKAEGRT